MATGTEIRDVVVPVMTGHWDNNSFAFDAIAGTAFLVGRRGIVVTAAHVANQVEIANAVLGFVNQQNKWTGVRILDFEHHPSRTLQ
jgi:hypothetical protein